VARHEDPLTVGYREIIAAAPTSPTFGSRAAAAGNVHDLTEEEYALARVIASEHSRGSPTEICCIGDATLNGAAAAGRTLIDHVTAGANAFGGQGTVGAGARKRPVSSARPPGARHLRAALALLRGRFFGLVDPPARGISKGARRFFDPRSQLSQHKGGVGHCHPLVILERWTFARKWGATRCTLLPKNGTDQQEWVGPIAGVDAYELMLFRKAGRDQAALYAAARRVIESQGLNQEGPNPIMPLAEFALVLALAAGAAWVLTSGGGALV
jgi:hypothetical protein